MAKKNQKNQNISENINKNQYDQIQNTTKEMKTIKKENHKETTPITNIELSSDQKNKTIDIKKRYISFNQRIIINTLIYCVCFIVALFLIFKAITNTAITTMNYTERGTADYKVYLKPNDFYKQEYLDKDMIYVASLIDNINISFNYEFLIDNNITADFNYKIKADLIIADTDGAAKYFTQEYTLLDNQVGKLENNNIYSISQDVNIDYDYYNGLANTFTTSYAVDTNSYLKVYLDIDKVSNEKNYSLNEKNTVSITIPLSQKAVEIKFDSDDSNTTKQIPLNTKQEYKIMYIVVAIILFILGLINLIKTIKLISKLFKPETPYDKFINTIMKDYDRLIVETSTMVDLEKKNIIKIEKFAELLDVRDNLKLPIMYYNIAKHQKCCFYILNNRDVYLLNVKAVDLEAQEQAKKENKTNKSA